MLKHTRRKQNSEAEFKRDQQQQAANSKLLVRVSAQFLICHKSPINQRNIEKKKSLSF